MTMRLSRRRSLKWKPYNSDGTLYLRREFRGYRLSVKADEWGVWNYEHGSTALAWSSATDIEDAKRQAEAWTLEQPVSELVHLARG